MDGWMDGLETVVDMIGRGNDKDSHACLPDSPGGRRWPGVPWLP
jgi:hypothetical protein